MALTLTFVLLIIEFTPVCLMQVTVRESFILLQLHVSYLDSDCITADNTCMRFCRGAAAPPLPAVADLPAEHTDLHMEEEEREGGGGDGVLFSFSPSALLHRLPAWKWHRCNPSSSSTSTALPLAFPSSLGSRGLCERLFVPNASTLQAPLLNLSLLSLSLFVCVRERETERVGGFLWFPLFIQAGEGRGVVGACCVLVLRPHCFCNWLVCVCVRTGLLLFSATAGMLLNGGCVSPDARQYCLSLSF